MKRLIGIGILFMIVSAAHSQHSCWSSSYYNEAVNKFPAITDKVNGVERFTRTTIQATEQTNARTEGASGNDPIIKIPVIFHVLYNQPNENISTEKLVQQIDILNKCFRKQNTDTINTPERFKSLAADIRIEFALAVVDPQGRATTGITRKYTPVKGWKTDDKMKFSAETGSDIWDSKSYLNIWVCNLKDILGYASFPGMPEETDGVVLHSFAIGEQNYFTSYNQGKTAVHEVGHWLNLKHLWGDADCGDDLVDDTPKQRSYTPGCPSGIRTTCGAAPNGDMYMNYMDFTNDACVNMFTKGQKERMLSLFFIGGYRNSILSSKALGIPWIEGGPLPDETPKWDHVKTYPNPATSLINLDFTYDIRWIGKDISIVDINGRIVLKTKINSALYSINVNNLAPGIYFIKAEKVGEKILEKFVKMK